MWGLDYTTVTVGQEVAIARSGNWRTHSEGVYTVVKANKIKIVLRRASDGYERTFSVKRKVELGRLGGESVFRSAYLEHVADMQKREARYAAERECKQAWMDAEQAARDKDLAALQAIVAKLEQMAV